jgi:hypothetical protein
VTISIVMSAPQLSDANTSSEWFRKVGEAGAADKQRSPSQAAISPNGADARRQRFTRLVTYTMVGLVAFTLLGVASFAWRQHAMQGALAAPLLASPELSPPPTPAVAPETPTEAAAPAATPVAPVASAVVPAHATRKAAPTKVKKTTRSPFLSSAKSTAAKR